MPNHVESTLDFTGPVDELEKMLNLIKGKDQWGKPDIFNFHAIVPMPKEIVEAHKKDNQNDQWYHWAIQHWGTKWGAYSVAIYKNLPANSLRLIKEMAKKKPPHGTVRICFQTAWSPATPVIEKLTEMFPKLDVVYAYIDEGMGFACLEKWKAGEMIESREMDGAGRSSDPVLRAVKRKLNTFPRCLEGVEPETDEED